MASEVWTWSFSVSTLCDFSVMPSASILVSVRCSGDWWPVDGDWPFGCASVVVGSFVISIPTHGIASGWLGWRGVGREVVEGEGVKKVGLADNVTEGWAFYDARQRGQIF